MIANTLIFLLGMLVTAVVAMVLAPLFWRKAQSLARREFEATIPISANEIRAEFDRVRAEAAVSVRRQEVLSAEAREKAAKAEADRGRHVVESTTLKARNRRLTQTIEEQDVELEATRAALAEREADIRDLAGEVADLRHAADLSTRELEDLGAKLGELDALSGGQAIELGAAKAKIERLESRLEPSSEDDADSRVERLAAELAALQQTLHQERAAATLRENRISALTSQLATSDADAAGLARETSQASRRAPKTSAERRGHGPAAAAADMPPRSGSPRFEAALGRRELPALDPAEEADIRERISDVAARVIRMTALAEGPGSPLASLLERPEDGEVPATAGSKPTLADRVRLLAEAERRTGS